MRLIVLLLAVFASLSTGAFEQFELKTEGFEADSEASEDYVLLKWRGEVVNNTVKKSKLSPYVLLLDRKGFTIANYKVGPVVVEGFESVKISERFKVDRDVWKNADSIGGRVEEAKTSSSETQVGEPSGPIEVELYVMNKCSWCSKARNFLKDNFIDFEEHNIDLDPYAKRRFRNKYNARTVPLLVINGRVRVSGFYQNQFEKARNIKNKYDEGL